jgi:DNA-binding beta-propeller fold protein YncE
VTGRLCAQFLPSGYVAAIALIAALLAARVDAADPNNPTGGTGLIAIAKQGAKIQFFDPVSHRLLVSLPVESNPHELAIAPDHKTAYVTIYGPGVYGANPTPNHKILVIDLASRSITDTIDIAPYLAPHGIQIDRQGLLYVTSEVARKLLLIDPKSKKIVDAIDTETSGHWVALLPDASKAYISSKDDKPYIAVIDLKARRVIHRIAAPRGTEGIAASPDGKHVAVAVHFAPALMLVDTVTDQVIANAALKDYPATRPNLNHQVRVRYTLDGRRILTSYFVSGLVSVIDAGNLNRQTVVPVIKGPMGFAFAPDGETALIASQDWGTIGVVDLSGKPHYVEDFDAGGGVETLAFY